MTDTEAKKLIKKVEDKLFGIKADNYFNYQVRYHLEEFKTSRKYADVLTHYVNHKPLYLQWRVFYYEGMIVDTHLFEKTFYARTNRNKAWKCVKRIAKKSML